MSSEAQSTASGRFQFLRELGRGAMGVVDLVYDRERGAAVARKRMHQASGETRFRIKQEFRQAQGVHHRNLARLYDLFADDADAFFTMEAVLGDSVDANVAAARERLGAGSPELLALIADRLRQLVDGVAALHAAGIVHRDIKPSNVLVEDDGHLVLLDFGFSSPLAADSLPSEERALAGTIPYMAPEILWGAPPSARSDWYAVGVIAAELCLGRTLFAGSLQTMLRDKDRPPETLRDAVPALAPALDEMVCSLLRRDPIRRPGDSAQIRAALGAGDAPPHVPLTTSGVASVFVGREEELSELERAVPGEARAQLVRVHGPSGIGKTALLRELTARLSRRPGWVVFRGRCHPREHLALKALDSVMDEVSRHLRHLGPRACARIAALEGSRELVRMFPVLTRVPELSALASASDSPHPQAGWIDGLRAFRGLWHELAKHDRVAVWIDDLQWADKDGLELLREVIAGDPPPITWILSQRSSDRARSEPPAPFARDVEQGGLELALDGLRGVDASELAIRLGASRRLAAEVEREAGGSPFMITELTRAALAGGELSSVERVLDQRLRSLDAEALSVLEHLALSASPLSLSVLARAASAGEKLGPVLDRLEHEGLVRTTYGGEAEAFAETAHDRIGDAVAARLSGAARRAVHLRLADALGTGETPGSRAATAFHYRQAGDLERGLALTLEAARDYTRVLAFDQASQLYEEALAIHPAPPPAALVELTAEALSRAGRCGDAAGRYAQAAELAAVGKCRALELQAGAHLLYAGRLEEGQRVLERVLARQGDRWPKAPLLSALFERARLSLSSRRPVARARPLDAESAERFDTLWEVIRGSSMHDHMATAALGLRALRVAQRLGDPSRLVLALGHDAASAANLGGATNERRAHALLARIDGLAVESGAMADRAYARMVHGMVAFFRGQWAQADEAMQQAMRLYRESVTGFLHEHNVIAGFRVSALEQIGDARPLLPVLNSVRTAAQRTGDVNTSFIHRIGSAGLVTLAADRPEEAIRLADAALATWPPRAFTTSHQAHFQVTLSARLYAGATDEAWAQIERTWPQLQGAHFLRLDAIGLQLRHMRARAALLSAHTARVRRADELRRIAAAEAARIGRSSLPHAVAMRATIEAALAGQLGDRERAVRSLETALAGFERSGMALAREATRLAHAGLCADREHARRAEHMALAWFAVAGVKNPQAMARSFTAVPDRSPRTA